MRSVTKLRAGLAMSTSAERMVDAVMPGLSVSSLTDVNVITLVFTRGDGGSAMVTVHDVAARSGVSIATVSRTLREPHRVSEDTRVRVLAAVDELGYRPNRAARSLRQGRTGIIALVVPDIENPYFASMTKGAQVMCRARGYGLVVVDTTERADIEDEEVRALRSQADGLILASSRLPDERLA